MKYYKIIKDGSFIGAIDSTNFFKEGGTHRRLVMSDENQGQFVEYNGILYRDYWMREIPNNQRIYQQASIIEITEQEYIVFIEAINKNETIIIEEEEDEIIPPSTPSIEEPDISLEFIRSSKITEMSRTCRNTIEGGFDLDLRGETHHFSLTTQDQLNLMSISVMVQTQDLIPYHADGEESTFYTAEEINQVIAAATSFKNYNLSYYNALKAYINSLDTIEAIATITYGTPIPDEYKSDVLMVLE